MDYLRNLYVTPNAPGDMMACHAAIEAVSIVDPAFAKIRPDKSFESIEEAVKAADDSLFIILSVYDGKPKVIKFESSRVILDWSDIMHGTPRGCLEIEVHGAKDWVLAEIMAMIAIIAIDLSGPDCTIDGAMKEGPNLKEDEILEWARSVPGASERAEKLLKDWRFMDNLENY